jgi:hypothetical protein
MIIELRGKEVVSSGDMATSSSDQLSFSQGTAWHILEYTILKVIHKIRED